MRVKDNNEAKAAIRPRGANRLETGTFDTATEL